MGKKGQLMETILSIIIPALLLAYYLRSDWKNIKDNRILIGVLVGGILFYYLGLFFSTIDPIIESLLKLSGACMFFTGVALHSVKRSQKENPGQIKDRDEE